MLKEGYDKIIQRENVKKNLIYFNLPVSNEHQVYLFSLIKCNELFFNSRLISSLHLDEELRVDLDGEKNLNFLK